MRQAQIWGSDSSESCWISSSTPVLENRFIYGFVHGGIVMVKQDRVFPKLLPDAESSLLSKIIYKVKCRFPLMEVHKIMWVETHTHCTFGHIVYYEQMAMKLRFIKALYKYFNSVNGAIILV